MTHDVERVLADIDADHGDRCVEFLRHGVLLVLSAPCQLLILAGPEHGRTIPLADTRRLLMLQQRSPLQAYQNTHLNRYHARAWGCVMRRREFFGFVGVGAAWPVAARAQPSAISEKKRTRSV